MVVVEKDRWYRLDLYVRPGRAVVTEREIYEALATAFGDGSEFCGARLTATLVTTIPGPKEEET